MRGFDIKAEVFAWAGALSELKCPNAVALTDLIERLTTVYVLREEGTDKVFPGSSEDQARAVSGVLSRIETGATTSVSVVTTDPDGTMRVVSIGGKVCERIGALFRAMTAIDDG